MGGKCEFAAVQHDNVGNTEAPGLQLRCFLTGVRAYSYRGRVRGENSPITFTIGEAPTITLDKARTSAAEIRLQCRGGINPNAQRNAQLAAEKAVAAAR